MNAKKFVAATSRDALLMVRNELGADAVILSNRKVDEGVEITALADADLTRLTAPKKTIQSAPPAKAVQHAPVSNAHVKYTDPDSEKLLTGHPDELSYADFASLRKLLQPDCCVEGALYRRQGLHEEYRVFQESMACHGSKERKPRRLCG